jgi:hypothetical protein
MGICFSFTALSSQKGLHSQRSANRFLFLTCATTLAALGGRVSGPYIPKAAGFAPCSGVRPTLPHVPRSDRKWGALIAPAAPANRRQNLLE